MELLLLSKNLEVLNVFILDKELVVSVLEYANNNKDIYDVVLIDVFKKKVTDTSNVVKIMLKLYSYDNALDVKKYIDERYANIKCYYEKEDNHYLVEIVSVNASKSSMIEKILVREKIVKDNVFTIGDGINDIDMIRKYNGYRVKNACDELKSITSKVVDSVNCLISEII